MPALTDLKPCPFCGAANPEINQIGNYATRTRGFEVRCLTFGCATKKRAMVIRQPLEKAREFAITAWNTRQSFLPDREAEKAAFLAGWWVNAAEPGADGAGSKDYLDRCAEADWLEFLALPRSEVGKEEAGPQDKAQTP